MQLHVLAQALALAVQHEAEGGLALRWNSNRDKNIKDLYKIDIIATIFNMPKSPAAFERLPPATVAALEKFGADLAVARLRRKESLASWAKRMGTTVPTLMRMEAGEPGVGIGVYMTALWLIGRDSALTDLAAPENDRGAIEMDVRQAVELGRARARRSAASRRGRKESNG